MGEPTLDSCICKGQRYENAKISRVQETLPSKRRRAKRRRGQKGCYRDKDGHLYKYCQNCGARFYPSMHHVRDQIYCKDADCWKERVNKRQRKHYRKITSDRELCKKYRARKTQEREARKKRRGISEEVRRAPRRVIAAVRFKNELKSDISITNSKLREMELRFMGLIRLTTNVTDKQGIDFALNKCFELGSEVSLCANA